MKNLEDLYLSRLSVLEFGQHIKSVANAVNNLNTPISPLTDGIIISYLGQLNTQLIDYDKATLQIAKSDETEKIVAADKTRDTALTATLRQLSVYELSDIEPERLAFASLETLFKAYKGIQNWNFEEESNGIDNLLAELDSPKYMPHVATLQLMRYVQRIRLSNDQFKTLFAKRTQETSSKEVFDTKKLRNSLKITYTDFCEYTLSMAKAVNTEQYGQILNIINTIRKYYSDMLAKRKPTKDGETPVDIVPIS